MSHVTSNDRPKALCPVCGTAVPLIKNGRVRIHRIDGQECEGSLMDPATVVDDRIKRPPAGRVG